MARVLTDLGEEWLTKTGLATATVQIGLYDDAAAGTTGDSIADTSDLPITSEPADGNYVRQTNVGMSAFDSGAGDWGIQNDAQVSFDVTNTTGTVDSWFMVANFQAADTGDTVANDHLVCTGALSQEYDLSNNTAMDINAGGVGFTVS